MRDLVVYTFFLNFYMSYQIEEIEDIGTAFAEKLKFINMRTSADLLAAELMHQKKLEKVF